jgi:hypothetical protein
MTGIQMPSMPKVPIEFIDRHHPKKEGGATLAEVG